MQVGRISGQWGVRVRWVQARLPPALRLGYPAKLLKTPLGRLARTLAGAYDLVMSLATTAKDFLGALELQPMGKRPNTSIIRPRTHRLPAGKGRRGRHGEMTDEDWDKFEKDIADAFEQVP